MPKTKILFLALILATLSSFLLTTNAQADGTYEYVLKLLFDNPFTVCCNSSPAQCIADAGPVTPENVTNYYPNPVTLFNQSEYDQLVDSQKGTNDTYSEKIALCLKQSTCILGVCPVGTKQTTPLDKTCSLKQSCADPAADPAQFCTPEIIASNGQNVCVSKYTAGHDCLKSSQCQFGSCIKYDYVCAQFCSSQESCPDKYFCSPGNTCEPQQTGDDTCKSDLQCLSENCYFNICLSLSDVTCKTDADCDANYYCRTEKTPKICKEKKYSWESCTKDNQCLSGKCYNNQTCVIADDQCKQDYNCQGDQYCDISSMPKKCVSKKAAGVNCNADKQCLSEKCVASKCTPSDQCVNDIACKKTEYCGTDNNGVKVCLAKKQLNAGCTANNECSSAHCIGSTCSNLTCQQDSECFAGMYCNTSSTEPACQPKKISSKTCTKNSECLSGDCSLGKCEKSACTTNNDCSAAQICDSVSKTCSEKTSYCTDDNDCWQQDYYTYCDKSEAVFTCKSKKSDGADCQSNGECKSGTCSYAGQCAKMGGGCYEDKDCSEGKKCNLTSHLCEEATPEVCEVAGGLIKLKCTVDQYCSVGTCVNKKDNDQECEIGGNCKSNFCHPDEKKCKAAPVCGNYSTVKELEYDEKCEVGYNPGTGTAYIAINCVKCKVIPEQVTGCTEDKNCGNDENYYCDISEKKCKTKLELTGSCTTDNQCKSGYCDITGVSTGTGSAVCAPKPKEGAAGAKPAAPIACDDKKYGTTKCPNGYYCDNNNACQFLKISSAKCTTGVECQSNLCAASGAGDICGCNTNTDCPYGEYCQLDLSADDPNTCQTLGTTASNNPCTTDNVCVSGKEYCDSGTSGSKKCQLKKKPGETCNEAKECLSAKCVNNKCGCSSNNECGNGFFCVAGVATITDPAQQNLCHVKLGADENCSQNEDFVCKSGKCENGKCAEPTAEQAGAAQIKSIELPNFLGETDFAVVVGRVIEFIIGLVGAAALGMFLYGGTLWLISRGESEMLKKGRETMIWAVIGLAIVFTSFILINFILKVLGSTAAQ